MSEPETWRRCSACKQPIGLGAGYWVCSVSTCNRKRTGLVFCTVSCWEVHLPTAKHRDAWAVERTAPTEVPSGATEGVSPVEREPQRRIVQPQVAAAPAPSPEVLIIASRLKEYVRARSGFNTSDKVLEPLSEVVRQVCDRAIERAASEGRKTILERDLEA